ncbi:hypothetical protein B6I21_01255, partial [candidate division KSB1 bacterium 4572_119]
MNHKTRFCSLIFIVVLLLLVVNSNLFGDDLKVLWNANTETDLSGYKIRYGTSPGSYSQIVDVGDTTNHTITGLATGFEYFFVITAYDTAGNESNFSDEVSFNLSIPDTIKPAILSASLINNTTLRINFSEKIQRTSAEDTSNYYINNGIEVYNAVLDSNEQSVFLTTSYHDPESYNLTVNNIQDLAEEPNTILSDTQISYECVQQIPFEISNVIVIDTTHIDVVFSKTLDITTAQDTNNYAIIPEIHITSAVLDPNELTVHLTTSKHEPGQYALIVNNLKDQDPNPNTIDDNTTFIYQFYDQIAPEILSIQSVDEYHLDITFSELLDKTSSENISNYQITEGIQVLGAVLDANNFLVHLTTTIHTEGDYTLRVENIKDLANPPNSITPPSDYPYHFVDTTPPSIVSVVVLSDTQLTVTFCEPIEEITAEQLSNYQIFNDINVLNATLLSDTKSVSLITSKHYEAHYILKVFNVRDRAASPNTIDPNNNYWVYNFIDETPPEIIDVTTLEDTLVKVTFSEKIEKTSAEDTSNYAILFGVSVLSSELGENETDVYLITTTHSQNNYVLMVNNIRDLAENPNIITENYTFAYQYEDISPPRIDSMRVIDNEHVDVVFNEPIQRSSAEEITNYSIDNGIEIISSELDAIESIVHLTTSNHEENEYTLTVNNVYDQADPANEILENSTFTYDYIDRIPPVMTGIVTLDQNNVEITFSEKVEKQSAETTSNYDIQNNINIFSAELDSTNKKVILNTSDHDEKVYFLSLDNITDQANNPNAIVPVSFFPYEFVDNTPPELSSVQAVNNDTVVVAFNEMVETVSAETESNYQISDNILVYSAQLNSDSLSVKLFTSKLNEQQYTVTVNNVKDRATVPNTIESNSTFNF